MGHKITVYDAKDKLGGLNEYGIAAYKSTNDFAQQELDYILDIGGINIETGMELGKQITLEDLQKQYRCCIFRMWPRYGQPIKS